MPADRRTRLFGILGFTYDTPGTPSNVTIRRLEDRILEMDDQWREMMGASAFTGIRLRSFGISDETSTPHPNAPQNKEKPDSGLRGRARFEAFYAKKSDAPRGYALPDIDQ